METVLTDLADVFQQETGHTVTLEFETTGVIRQKLAAGETVDAVILNDYEIEELAEQGIVVPGTQADIARFGLGLAVRQGAPLPDISTAEALKQTLLSAKAIAYADPDRGRAGAHFEHVVLPRLGIADAVTGNTLLSKGGSASSEAVANGDAELCVTGMCKSILVEGVTLVGPLPKDLQKVITLSAALVARSPEPEIARAFVAFLAQPSWRSKFADQGLDYRE